MSGIDVPAFIEAYGLAGLIILVLLWVVRALWVRLTDVMDQRLEDQKAHTAQMMESSRTHQAQMADNTRTLERALDVVEGRSRG